LLIRKGEQIANKSRLFEHEELINGELRKKNDSRVQRERQYFPKGKVSQNKDWLQHRAFVDGGDKKDSDEKENIQTVMEKRKLIESAFKKKPTFR
jgi:hypothetical protein